VLKDVDGIVFVADSAPDRLQANLRAMVDMLKQIREIGRSPKDIPFILQCNKQDVPNAVDPALLSRILKVPEKMTVPATALSGEGTSETLKKLIGQVLAKI